MEEETEKPHSPDYLNVQHISKPTEYVPSYPSSVGPKCSSSSNPKSFLKSLLNFGRTRQLYVAGCRVIDLVKQLQKTTKVQFQVIEQSEKYGIIHFESPISSAVIYRINKNEELGLQFFVSRKFRQAKCREELLIKSSIFMEDEFEDEDRSKSNSYLYQKNNFQSNQIWEEVSFKTGSYEDELFYEMGSLLMKNLSWGIFEMYNYLMTTSIMDPKCMATITLILSNRKKHFSQVIDGRDFAVSSTAKQLTSEISEVNENSAVAHHLQYSNSQSPQKLLKSNRFKRNNKDLQEINETKTITTTSSTQPQEITTITAKIASQTINHEKQTQKRNLINHKIQQILHLK